MKPRAGLRVARLTIHDSFTIHDFALSLLFRILIILEKEGTVGSVKKRDAVEIVSILASAGGLVSLSELLHAIPNNFPVPILYQQPVLPSRSHELRETIALQTDLHVLWLRDGQKLKGGHLYLCPSGSWVVVDRGVVSLIPLGAEGSSLPAVELAGSLIASYDTGCVLVVLKEVEMKRGAGLLHRFERRGVILSEAPRGHVTADGLFGLVVPLHEIIPCLLSLLSWPSVTDVASDGRARPNAARRSSALKEFLHDLVALALRLHGTAMGIVQLYDGEARTLHIAAQCGFAPGFLRSLWNVSSADMSACSRALRRRETVMIEDIYRDAAYKPFVVVAEEAGYVAVQATPLIGSSGRVTGVLSTYFDRVKRLTRGQVRILNVYMRLAADVIERLNARRNHGRKFAVRG